MKTIVDKKSFGVAILHYITAGVLLAIGIFLCISAFYGNLLQFENTENDLSTGIGNAFVAVFALIFLLCTFAGIVIAIPAYIVSGCKLLAKAQGKTLSKASLIITLIIKTVAFVAILFTTIFMFEIENGLVAAILHILMLAFILVSSVLEVWARKGN